MEASSIARPADIPTVKPVEKKYPPLDMTKLPSLPTDLVDTVAIDYEAATVYATPEARQNPFFLSWENKCRRANYKFDVKVAQLDFIVELLTETRRLRGGQDVDDSQETYQAFAREIIAQAVGYQASEIHIMLQGPSVHAEIQVEVNGSKWTLTQRTFDDGKNIIRAIYQGLAAERDNSFKELEYQNAQIRGDKFPPEMNLSSIRVIRGPSYPDSEGGQFMTLRLQYRSLKNPVALNRTKLPKLSRPRQPEGKLNLPAMGFAESSVKKMLTLMNAPNGIILYTGPTASGKTTTIQEIMMQLARDKPHLHQVTIEDPVEYPKPWAIQMSIPHGNSEEETSKAFVELARVTLRMAPKIILYGELRDPQVALKAMEAAMTGHKVLSTMHLTDPYQFADRIELMDPYLLNRQKFCDHKVIRGVMAQRLLPHLCQNCSKPYSEVPEEQLTEEEKLLMEVLPSWGDTSLLRREGDGCEHCEGKGSRGRFAIAEVVVTSDELMRDMLKLGTEEARLRHRQRPDSDPPLIEQALALAFAGKVDPVAVQELVEMIDVKGRT